MSDRISISYDANVDDLNRKLDALIAKNKELAAHATAAAKALSNIASAQGLSTINNINNSFNTTVNVLAQVNTNLSQVNNQLNNTVNLSNRVSNAIGGVRASSDLLTRAFQMLTTRMIAAFSINAVIDFTKSLVDVERQFEILQNRINFVAGTTTGGEAVFGRLQKTANELGIGIQELTEGFSGFAIAAKMAGFSSAAAEEIFSKVATSLRAAGASSLQTQRAFYALQQMLSKGVVAAEELRRQLGEALPGASDLMTRAYNRLHPGQELTNRQFTKMLEEGKIISAEILPEFARVLEQEFGPALSGKKNSLDAILTRISNQFIEFKKNLSDLDFIKNAFGGLATFLTDINNVMTNEELTFKEKVDGFMRAGTRLNAFEIEKNKKLAAQGSFLAQYYLDGQRVLEESAKKAEKRTEDQTKRESELIKSAEKQYEIYKKLGEIEQERFENELQMRVTLSDKDMQELSADSRAIKDLYETIGKAIGATREEWNMYADAGEKVVRAQIHKRTGGGKAVFDAFNKQLQQKREEIKLSLESIKKAKEEDQATLDLIKTKRIAASQGGPAGQGGADPQKEAIAAAKERIALEETLLLKTKENTVAYVNQMIKVIEARKNLVKLEKAGTPLQMGLDIAKLDKELEKYKKMINSFTPEMADIVEEGVYVPSAEALERLSKEIKDLTKQQLEDRAAAIQTEIQFHEEGTDRRLELEKALVMAKAQLAAKDAEIQGKSVKEIEAIFAKANLDIADLDKKFYDGKQKEAEDYAEFYKRLQDGLDGYEGNSLQRRIKAIREYYGKLKAEAFLYGRTKEEMDALDANRDKAIFQENLKEVGKFVNTAAGIYGQFTQIQQMEYENQKVALDNKLAQGLISEEEYNTQVTEIERKRFEQNKQTQKIEVLINTASAIARAFSDLGPVGGAIAAFALGAMSIKQISLIDSAQFPQAFKDGVIDLKGPGSETSDSIPARLSRGESVMTADETKRYKPVLQAIRDGEFEAFVAKKYTGAMAMSREQGSFAQNISNSLDMNNTEMVDAIRKNKSVKIANWDDFSKIMSKPKTAHKVYRRRAW